MIQKIWKVELEIADEQLVILPKGARILSIQEQTGKVSMWFQFNQDETRTQTYKNRCFGTGQPMFEPETLEYIGTAQVLCGKAVFHYFIDYSYKSE